MRGRLSATLLENALLAAPPAASANTPAAAAGGLPRAFELWLRSLPPSDRSGYVVDLVESDFKDTEWGQVGMVEVGANLADGVRPTVPLPLGDDRHSPRGAAAAAAVQEMRVVLQAMVLTRRHEVDTYLLEDDEESFDIAFAFGIDAAGLTPAAPQGSWASPAALRTPELMLRAWWALYLAYRTSRTELEVAVAADLSPPPAAAAATEGATLTAIRAHFLVAAQRCLSHPAFKARDVDRDVLREAVARDTAGGVPWRRVTLDATQTQGARKGGFGAGGGGNVVPLPVAAHNSCDCCDEEPAPSACGVCHVAVYCGQECQREDRQRHGPLCMLYAARGSGGGSGTGGGGGGAGTGGEQ